MIVGRKTESNPSSPAQGARVPLGYVAEASYYRQQLLSAVQSWELGELFGSSGTCDIPSLASCPGGVLELFRQQGMAHGFALLDVA